MRVSSICIFTDKRSPKYGWQLVTADGTNLKLRTEDGKINTKFMITRWTSLFKTILKRDLPFRSQSMIERIVLQMIHNFDVLIPCTFIDIIITIFNQQLIMRDFQVIYF